MVYYSLHIKARFCPEIIERILRVIRHRGFIVHSLHTLFHDASNYQQINILITVASKKAIHLLLTQLNKIINVENVTEI